MRPAKFNKHITVQQRTKVENDIGGWSNDWADMFTTKANVSSLDGRTRLEMGKLAYQEAYNISFRARAVNPEGNEQVIYNGKAFQINVMTFEANDRFIKMTISR